MLVVYGLGLLLLVSDKLCIIDDVMFSYNAWPLY